MKFNKLVFAERRPRDRAAIIKTGCEIFDARLMSQQLMNGDLIAGVLAIVGQVIRDAVVQLDFAFLNQLDD